MAKKTKKKTAPAKRTTRRPANRRANEETLAKRMWEGYKKTLVTTISDAVDRALKECARQGRR